MKTAEEILIKNGCAFVDGTTPDHFIAAMESYANQFKYDFSKNCKCGDESTGETWCCNVCGLPTTAKNQDKWISVEEKVNKLMEAITALHPNLNMSDKKQEALYLSFHELKSALPSPHKTK